MPASRGEIMNYAHAVINWGHVAVRSAGYGAVSIALGPITPNHAASRWAARQWSIGCCDGVGIRRQLINKHILDEVSQAIFIANHLSALDILIIGSFLEHDFRWLAKDAVFRIPFLGWHLRLAGHVPVHRKKKIANKQIPERIHRLAASGASLLFFPEGTRSATGQLQPFMPGAFMAAVAEDLPIVPLVLRGTGELLSKGALGLAVDQTTECSLTVLPPIPALAGPGGIKARAGRLRAAAYEAFSLELCGDGGVPRAGVDDAAEPVNSRRGGASA